MSAVLRAATLRRELKVTAHIPYTAQVSDTVVRTTQGDYVQVFQLGGASFESADDSTLNTWHERLNVLWRNVASPQVALWSHIIRRREWATGAPGEGDGFAGRLEAKYRARLAEETLMVKGTDPVSKEALPRDCIIHRTDVLRALLAGLGALEQTAARAQRRAQLPENVGRSWTTEEEKELVTAFRDGDSPTVIARAHGRTLRAIEARLEKLGLITAEQRTTRGGFTGTT